MWEAFARDRKQSCRTDFTCCWALNRRGVLRSAPENIPRAILLCPCMHIAVYLYRDS